MVLEPPVGDVVAVRAVGGYLLELSYPHGQVRLLDAELQLGPRAYDAQTRTPNSARPTAA